jgi:hypothetical protein
VIRSLVDTIDQILALVPRDQGHLRGDLTEARERARKTPPEAMFRGWQHVAKRLGFHLQQFAGQPMPVWADQVVDLFEDFSEAA